MEELAKKIAMLKGKKLNISSSSIKAGRNMINDHLLNPMTKNNNLELHFRQDKGRIYTSKFNGQTLKHPMTSNRGTLEIKIPQNVRSAQISIQSHGSKFTNFFIVTSVLSWLVLLGYIILKKDRDRVRL